MIDVAAEKQGVPNLELRGDGLADFGGSVGTPEMRPRNDASRAVRLGAAADADDASEQYGLVLQPGMVVTVVIIRF